MKRITLKLLAFVLGLFLICDVTAQEESTDEKVSFKYGGFVKTDYLFTQYNNGAYSGAGRDFHIPGTIPVGDGDMHRYTDFHVKESRFNFDVSTTVNGKKLRSFLEMDFMLSAQGNERVSNSFSPRIRHFFLEYDKVLLGQTWSTFMVVIIPDELDFLGAPEGLVFVRQPMARLTLGDFQVALENPLVTYTVVDPATGTPSRSISETAILPDLVGRYNMKLSSGKLSFAVIGRQLEYTDGGNTSHTALGFGATAGGKIKIGSKDDIRFVGTVGSGLGRYLALNFVNSAGVDNSANLKPIFTMNGYVAYLHHWTSKLRSSFSASFFKANNDQNVVGDFSNDMAMSFSGNIIYQPINNLIFGAEPIYGYRELVDGTNGDFYRLQLSARYAFSFKTSVSK